MQRLRRTIPAARLAPYEAACSGTRTDAIELYRWAALLGLAVFDDIATVEVALRSAMASAASNWICRGSRAPDGSGLCVGSSGFREFSMNRPSVYGPGE